MNMKSRLEKKIVRYADFKPCKTAFIDAHTPGSNQKENFTIIGPGVSESPDQHIHIKDTPGFNIGAAGQPPKCRNSLHSHRTAEVFFVQKGRWRFFWGKNGTAGEVTLEEGDIFDIPTGIFRGFENIGKEYGIIMAILGGNDAGGGVIWAPQVIQEAKKHGLILAETGRLYDTKKGQKLPKSVKPMKPLTAKQVQKYPEIPVEEVVPYYVGRYNDMVALAKNKPAEVIGKNGIIKDKPGFEVQLITRDSLKGKKQKTKQYNVLMIHQGHWKIKIKNETEILNPGDVCAIKPNEEYNINATMNGPASIFRVRSTDDPAGPTVTGL